MSMVNGLHLYSAFLTSGHSKSFTVWPHIHPGQIGRGVLAELDGGRDRTGNLPVTSRPALPAEPHAAAATGSVTSTS